MRRQFPPMPTKPRPRPRWWFGVAYLLIGLAFLAVEISAIANDVPGDTFTEFVRSVIFIHEFVWYSSFGLFVGFGGWFTLHMWWRRR